MRQRAVVDAWRWWFRALHSYEESNAYGALLIGAHAGIAGRLDALETELEQTAEASAAMTTSPGRSASS